MCVCVCVCVCLSVCLSLCFMSLSAPPPICRPVASFVKGGGLAGGGGVPAQSEDKVILSSEFLGGRMCSQGAPPPLPLWLRACLCLSVCLSVPISSLGV